MFNEYRFDTSEEIEVELDSGKTVSLEMVLTWAEEREKPFTGGVGLHSVRAYPLKVDNDGTHLSDDEIKEAAFKGSRYVLDNDDKFYDRAIDTLYATSTEHGGHTVDRMEDDL